MPPLATLTVPPISVGRKVSLLGMWGYLMVAMGVVVLRIVELAAVSLTG